MEHPSLNVAQLKKEHTLEEIQNKIRDIVTRLNFAYRTGNQPMINQLQMVYESYSRAQLEMVNELFNGDGNNHQGKIDIS
jgi:uncharacterized membrane protein (DUF106 family)